MGCVYLITSPSGKQYVGMTTRTLEKRWREHVYHAQRHHDCCPGLERAIRKYGPEAFEHEILHDGIAAARDLKRYEVEAIAAHKTLAPDGYNWTAGGDGGSLSPQAEAKKRRAMQTAAYRAVQAEIAAKRWEDHEYREQTLGRLRASAQSSHGRQRTSHTSTARWGDPDYRERVSARIRTAWSDGELRQQQSERTRESQNGRHPNIFADGQCFKSMAAAAESISKHAADVHRRVHSTTPRFRWWHTIPNHNNPMHDGFEECAAIIAWAKANPDHENVPHWALPYLDHVPPITPGKHGKAPAWAA